LLPALRHRRQLYGAKDLRVLVVLIFDFEIELVGEHAQA
jgi:hypothetical protein